MPSEIRKPAVVISAIAFGLLAIWYFITASDSSTSRMGSSFHPTYKFETVTGFFMQDEPDTPESFEYDKHNFGLIDRDYDTDGPDAHKLTPWQRFEDYVHTLVKSSPPRTTYKVIYQGRHGEGYHNVAEDKYGTPAWNDYWSKLDGDGTLYWFDAHLTEKGKRQALHNNAFFRRQLTEPGMPAPEKYYTSPLYRCLQTANSTFNGLELPENKPFKPVVKELLREVMGEHTCDKRSSRTVIGTAVSDWEIEPGFTEEDQLWQADHRETFSEHDARTQELLEDIFENDKHNFISFTSHSGAEASLLRVIGHREFRLPTGGLIPLFVKATRID